MEWAAAMAAGIAQVMAVATAEATAEAITDKKFSGQRIAFMLYIG